MDFLEGIVDHNTNFLWAMSPRDQAYCVSEFYQGESENTCNMLVELAYPTATDPVCTGSSESFMKFLAAAFQADLSPKASAEEKAEAFRKLGELVSNWAYNYAQRQIDAHIDDHIDELVEAKREIERGELEDRAYEMSRE